jgi:hypothetical protein
MKKSLRKAIQKARPNHNDGKALSPNLAPQCCENISFLKEPRFWPALQAQGHFCDQKLERSKRLIETSRRII